MNPGHDRSLLLLANNGDIGGGEIMLLEMARMARDAGIAVTVVAPEEPPEIADTARGEGFLVETFAGVSRLDQARSLRALLRTNTRDVLWCNGLAPALATTGWSRRVAHIHQLPTWKHIVSARLSGLRARETVVPSFAMAHLLPGSRVMHNWTAPIAIAHPRRTPDRPVLLGFIGRVTCAKGVDVLFSALKILEDESPGQFRLRIAGDDRFAAVGEAELIAEAQRPVEHLVDLLGWVEPSEFLARVDLAVFPSIARESFGLVVAEAMSARMPFVISNSGALPEVAGPDHPFVAVAGNPEALASSIRAAVSMREDQPDHFETLLDNAQARWEQEFSPAAGRVRFLQVLRELGFSPTDQKGI